MRRSSHAERKSRATTNRMPSRLSAALAPTHGNPASPMKRRNCSASGWSRSLAGRSIARKNGASDEKVAIQVTIWCRRRLMTSPIGSATAMAPIMNSALFGSAIMKPLNSPTSSSTASPGNHGKAARAMAAQPRAGRDQPDRVGAEQRRQCIGDRQLGMAKLGQGQGMVQSEGDEDEEQARRNDGSKNSARNIAPGIDVFTAKISAIGPASLGTDDRLVSDHQRCKAKWSGRHRSRQV